MKLDLFHHFKSAGDYVTSSAAGAQLKAWDHRHEFSPVEEEENYLPAYRTPDLEQIEALNLWADLQDWEPLLHREYTCYYETGEIVSNVTLEDKLEHIVNPALTMGEVWELTSSEVSPYGDDYDPWDDYDPYYDYDPFREYDYEFPYERMMEEADSPPHVFFLHELEKESEKYIEDCKVWNQTMQEIAQFEERPCTPEPEPRITNHHYRKAA